MTDLLVLHDLGSPGGAPWGDAFAGWPGRVFSPDLPGHGTAAPPVGGQYEAGDAVYVALELLRSTQVDELVVVGVGHSGAAARILALGGRAVGLVLVDGLGGPWRSPSEIDDAQRSLRRQILASPSALGPPSPGATDPRAGMVIGTHDRNLVTSQMAALAAPVLVIETPDSPTPDATDIVEHADRVTLVPLPARDPDLVAEAVRVWQR